MVRTRPRSAAVREAFLEGRFLRKTGFVAKRGFKKIVASMDKHMGNAARRFVYSRTEVIPRKIMFISFQGDYTCNPKYITEELLRREDDVDIVWSLRAGVIKRAKEDPGYLPSGVRYVEQFTESFFAELASSQIWVANSVDFLKRMLPKKEDQFFIETWHGSLGLKRFDAAVNKGKAWVKAAQVCADYADVLISNSTFEDEVYRGSFWGETPILRYGHPRNDVFFSATEEEKNRLKIDFCTKNEISSDSNLVLYAPTFRDDHQFDCYSLIPSVLQEALEERFGGKWEIVTRYHPTVAKFVSKRSNKHLGINATDYPDIQELMLFCDVAITDYSSWIYDFMLSGKPCFIYAADLDKYRNQERGFYYPIDTTPFAIARNNDEIAEAIRSFDEERYSNRLRAFLNDKGCMEDGAAAGRVVDLIEKVLEGGKRSVALEKCKVYEC